MRHYRVTETIHRILLAWGNCYLITDGATGTLIDTGLKKDRADLLQALKEIGLSAEQITAVVLTHGHTDHAGNAAYFQKCGAKVYAHPKEVCYLRGETYAPKGLLALQRPFHTSLLRIGEKVYPVEPFCVDHLVCDGEFLEVPGGHLRVISSPGHTLGHTAYWYEPHDTLFCGDAILNIIPVRLITRLRFPMPIFSTDMELAYKSATALAESAPKLLLSGHGLPVIEDTPTLLKELLERELGALYKRP